MVVCQRVLTCCSRASFTLGGSVDVVVVVVVVAHLGVAVADGDGDDAAEHVEVPPALVVPQPLHAALVDQQGRPVVGRHGRVQVLLPDLLRLLHRRPLILGGVQELGFLAPTSRGADRATGYQPRWSNRQPHNSLQPLGRQQCESELPLISVWMAARETHGQRSETGIRRTPHPWKNINCQKRDLDLVISTLQKKVKIIE